MIHKIMTIAALSALACTSHTGAHAEDTEATLRAYAAGYKAAFTCSGLFNAGKTLEQIKAHELTGIYPNIQPILDTLPPAVIDHDKKVVSVKYSETMPPRIAKWEAGAGCHHLPVGAVMADIKFSLYSDTAATGGRHMAESRKQAIAAQMKKLNPQPWTKFPTTNGKIVHKGLEALVDTVFGSKTYGKDALTTAVFVATPDAPLVERYIEGFDQSTSQRTWSVAKSIGASLIGAAVQEGKLKTDQPATISAWQSPVDPRRNITLENLLHMASGLDSDRRGNRTDRVYMGGGRMSDTATEHALEAMPGTRWKYANNDTMLAARALKEALEAANAADGTADPDVNLSYARNFFKTLGMFDTVAETDWEGNMILSSQVWTTSRDLARLGILYLQDGVWEGKRILPEGWVKYVSSPLGPQPPEKRGNGTAIPGYGAQFWLFNERFPNIPNDTFAAMGNRGQYLVIIPSKNLVIVRRGYDPAGGEGFKLDKFIEDVLAVMG